MNFELIGEKKSVRTLPLLPFSGFILRFFLAFFIRLYCLIMDLMV